MPFPARHARLLNVPAWPVVFFLWTHPGVGAAILAVATSLLRRSCPEGGSLRGAVRRRPRCPRSRRHRPRKDAWTVAMACCATDLYGASLSNLEAGKPVRLGTPCAACRRQFAHAAEVANDPSQGPDTSPATAAAGARNELFTTMLERELISFNRSWVARTRQSLLADAVRLPPQWPRWRPRAVER